MDPVGIGTAAVSGAAGTIASTSVQKSNEKFGWKGLVFYAAVLAAVLVLFQHFKNKR